MSHRKGEITGYAREGSSRRVENPTETPSSVDAKSLQKKDKESPARHRPSTPS
jgi:hypothetical protein